MIEHIFETAYAMTKALAGCLSDDLSFQIASSDSVSIAVGGGKTPIGLYEELSNADLDWSKVVITLTDERWVVNSHNDSNEGMVVKHLLQNRASCAKFIPLKTKCATAKEAQSSLDQSLRASIPSLDLVVLGMGSDGHFASLFPGYEELNEGLNPNNEACCIATTSPVDPQQRMSLTLSMILSAKKVYLMIQGDDKLNAYRRASMDKPASGDSLPPIAAVLKQAVVPVEVFWSPSSN